MTQASIILRTTARFMMPLMLLFSLFIFLRGHNEPGGGFIAGLVAASGFALYAMAWSVADARSALRINPIKLMGVGLLVAVSAGFMGMFVGKPFMTGLWNMDIKQGTPVLFDLGVFLVVIGVVLTAVFTLSEED